MGRFSSLWRQAARSLGFEDERRSKRQRRSSGPGSRASLGWVTPEGVANFASAQFVRSTESSVVARTNSSVPAEAQVWVASASGDDYPGAVESCERDEADFVLSIRANQNARAEDQKHGRLGRVRMKWVDGQGFVVESKVSIDSGAEGQVFVTAPEAVEAPAVVFLSGYEFFGLAGVTACEPAGENYRLTLEMADEVFSRKATAA